MDTSLAPIHSLRPIHFDAQRRRLWLFGQRCHHGATGALIAATALTALGVAQVRASRFVGLVATGGLMMAHDWADRSLWFEPGRQSQP